MAESGRSQSDGQSQLLRIPWTDRLTIKQQLWLSFWLLAGIMTISWLLAFGLVANIDRDMERMAQTDAPLEQAVLEMEINAGETALAVGEYVLGLDSASLQEVEDSRSDFGRFVTQFNVLAKTDEVRRIGWEIEALYQNLVTLGDEIIALADRRAAAIGDFRRDVQTIQRLVEGELKNAIDRTQPEASQKLEAALELEISVGRAFAAIEGYVLHADPARRAAVESAVKTFQEFEAGYRSSGLSAAEQGWLEQVVEEFYRAMAAGDVVEQSTDQLNLKLKAFGRGFRDLDTILDERIQPLLHDRTIAAANDAQHAVFIALGVILAMAVLGLGVAGVSTRIATEKIGRPLQALIEGTKQFAQGNLDHRIAEHSGSELGTLARAFNAMTRNLGQSRRELLDREGRLKSVLDTAADGIITIDRKGSITSFNMTAATLFGYQLHEVLGQNVKILMPQPYAEEHDGYLARYHATGEKRIIGIGRTVVGKRKDGTTFPMDLAVSQIPGAAEMSYTGIVRDITDRVRAEEELKQLNASLEREVERRTRELHEAQEELVRKERLAALGQLTGTVSHELRNPLGAMASSVAAIKKLAGKDNLLLNRTAAVLDRSIARCDNIIGDLLDYSRVRPLECEATAVDGWLAGLLVEYRLPEGITLHSDLASGAEADIDRDRLRRALINLLDNACHAIAGPRLNDVRDGPGRVTIATRQKDGQVSIEIADTGHGVPEEELQRIFEPLFSTKSFGVGLGLPLVKRVTEQHHGTVEVESKPGEGTRFVLRLPMKAPVESVA